MATIFASRNRCFLAGVALTVAYPAIAADSVPADQIHAVRCVMVMDAVSGLEDKAFAEMGAQGGLFWLGRLDPAMPSETFEKIRVQLRGLIKADDLDADIKGCVDEMRAMSDKWAPSVDATAPKGN